MDNEMKVSYFTSNSGALFYFDATGELCEKAVSDLLKLHDVSHNEFVDILLGINRGSIGLCENGQYMLIEKDAPLGKMFRTVPKEVFKKLVHDRDTIRLRYKNDDVMLMRYNPSVIPI